MLFQPTSISTTTGANLSSVLSACFDGSTANSPYAYIGDATQDMIMDFGSDIVISSIKWWMYADGRVFRNVALYGKELSGDAWTTLRSPANWQADSNGLTVTLGTPMPYRYIKFYAEGNASYNSNEYTEIQVEAEYDVDPISLDEPVTYSYTGGLQLLSLVSGRYKLELYGASGGASTTNAGGKGGYCTGEIELLTDELLLIYVGGEGNRYNATPFGWNGGGWCNHVDSGSGGGASDIRIGGIALTDRVIVAAGGGGTSIYDSSDGGGLVGEGFTSVEGGTQSAGGAHSSGGLDGTLGIGGGGYCGGGGGYYGGGGGSAGGGGGSSFYGTLANAETIPGVNEGNGYIVITPFTTATNRRYAQII